jgi:hypothetical protein
VATRKRTEIPLIDQPLDQLLGAKLPKNLSVLRHFFYQKRVLKKNDIAAAKDTVSAVLPFWEKAGIKTKSLRCCKDDVLKLHDKYKVSS